MTVHGRGGHGAFPHAALDPVPVVCEIVLALQNFVTRRFDVFDPVVVTVGRLEAGTVASAVALPNSRSASSPGETRTQ